MMFFARTRHSVCDKAEAFAQQLFQVDSFRGERGDAFPDDIGWQKPDIVVSFLSPWIIPVFLLNTAKIAINFHPGPPEYPGTGCLNFALYDGASSYGVTAHRMSERPDFGSIVAYRRFPIFLSDTVTTLLERSHDHLLMLFYETLERCIIADCKLKECAVQWGGVRRRRRALDELGQITPQMSPNEVDRRIRATSYKEFQPTLTLHGHTFTFTP